MLFRSAGLDVRPPADADGCRLDIAWPGARCTLAVGEGGSAEWEYWPWSADDADPDLTADLATVLLTGRPGPQPRLGSRHQRENVTFKGIVGLELKARGLDVELAVYCDETAFDTFAEIIATVPGQGDGGGQVCVADDGGLTWTRDYLAEAAALVSAEGLCGLGDTILPDRLADAGNQLAEGWLPGAWRCPAKLFNCLG